jgi:hypothetical protein
MTDVRPWTYAALFGALWGALEATIGTAMYLGNVPQKGVVMGLLGLLCLVCLRRLQPRPGVCLLAGAVAVFLKIFTLGGLYPGPIIGIAVQAVAVEIAMTGSGGRSIGAAVGGAVTLATNPLQMVGMMWLLTGTEGVMSYLEALRAAAAMVGLAGLRPVVVFTVIVLAKGLVGAAGGMWAWWVAGRVMRRLGVRA